MFCPFYLLKKIVKWVYLDIVFRLKSNFEHKKTIQTYNICRGYEICHTNYTSTKL